MVYRYHSTFRRSDRPGLVAGGISLEAPCHRESNIAGGLEVRQVSPRDTSQEFHVLGRRDLRFNQVDEFTGLVREHGKGGRRL
jgi:hypothetical protein